MQNCHLFLFPEKRTDSLNKGKSPCYRFIELKFHNTIEGSWEMGWGGGVGGYPMHIRGTMNTTVEELHYYRKMKDYCDC